MLARTIWYPAATSLILEQSPHIRGSIMSLNDASRSLGMAIGINVGGFIFLRYSYGFHGIIFGGLGIIVTILYCARDPEEVESVHWMTYVEITQHSDIPEWTKQTIKQVEEKKQWNGEVQQIREVATCASKKIFKFI